jgi:Protein of unknown function (DUF3761)
MTEECKLMLGLLLIATAILIVARFPGLLVGFIGRVTARCRDGNLSFSTNPCGTCSHHGGVEEWL